MMSQGATPLYRWDKHIYIFLKLIQKFINENKDSMFRVQSVDITPRIASTGIDITIKVEVKGNSIFEITSLLFKFRSSSGLATKEILLTNDKQNDIYTGVIKFADKDERGKWKMEYVYNNTISPIDGKQLQDRMWGPPASTNELFLKVLRLKFVPDPDQVYFRIIDGLLDDLQLYNIDDNGWGYIIKTGEVYIEPKYAFASEFFNGLALVVTSDKKWGYIDKSGQEVIKPQFEQANDFSEGYAVVERNKKFRFINIKGDIVIDTTYDYAGPFSGGVACVKTGTSFGFIDNTGKAVIPFIYENAKDLSEGLIAVRNNWKWGYIDKTGKNIIKCTFESAAGFSEGLAAIQTGGK